MLGDHKGWADNVRVGVSTNFNKLCGMQSCQVGGDGGRLAPLWCHQTRVCADQLRSS